LSEKPEWQVSGGEFGELAISNVPEADCRAWCAKSVYREIYNEKMNSND